ncbi:MAG: crossover junction endodeoxyribonuclease RuvC [Candidatus Pacebacteria bacterium]|nr:crossover junction endodeoxyribonuclease RuvC [Candidatus Paceibacterota bacterium]
MKTIRILGIDPALRCTGYAVIESDGQTHSAVDCGVIKTPARQPLSECLRRLNGGMLELVKTFAPNAAAIEGGFFSKNAKTAMLLGCARGSVIAALAQHRIDVYEYAPRRVKQAICGYGNAGKEQIATVMSQLLGIDTEGVPLDATDAFAIAICHSHTFFTNQGIFLPEPI